MGFTNADTLSPGNLSSGLSSGPELFIFWPAVSYVIITEINITPEIMKPKIFYIYMLIMALGGSEVI